MSSLLSIMSGQIVNSRTFCQTTSDSYHKHWYYPRLHVEGGGGGGGGKVELRA